MRKSYIYAMLIPSVAISLAACDDNAWNDKLDGFESNPPITDVKTIEYTLTDADYAAIAVNATNVGLAGEANAEALAAVGTQHYFTDVITATDYVPAFLESTSFPYFTLSEGSAVKLTYRETEALPELTTTLASAPAVTLSTDDYQLVWDSDDDYVNCFTPSMPASKFIPKLLPEYFPEAEEGAYAIVTSQVSDQEPVFGTPDNPEEPSYTHTLVTAMANGTYVIVADGNAATTISKGYGYLALTEVTSDGAGLNVDEDAEGIEFTFTATDGGYYLQDCNGRYLSQSGTFNSFNFSDAAPETGAVWEVTINDDGTAKILNKAVSKFMQYDPNYSSYGSYADARGVMPSLYVKSPAAEAKAPVAKAPLATVPYTTEYSVWQYAKDKWSAASNVAILQPSDYTEMQQKYANLSGTLPAQLLPIYLAKKYPYAQADNIVYVLYQYYDGKATKYRCDQYAYDGAAWILNNGIKTVTSQFVRKADGWKYDPSVTLVLPVGKSMEPSTTYYQACVDWVYENIDKPLGSTSIKSGLYYVTSYGNNEYYSGTSAFQNNVDLRAAKAKEQYPDGYEGMTDDQIVELMKHRFAFEVMPGALKTLHPDAAPTPDVEVFFTITFGVYTGTNATYTIVYKVTAPATFEFVSCDWWENGVPAE